jgi:serine/threonine-protein kinase
METTRHSLKPRLIGPPPAGTSVPLDGRRHRRPIPRDLLQQASRRLGVVCLISAVLWVVSAILYHLVDRVMDAGDVAWMSLQPSDAIVAVGTIVSLALFVYTRRSQRDPAFILDLGLVYMVVLAAIIGLIMHWDPSMRDSTRPTVTWTGVLIVVFAATLPSTPIKFAAAAFLAVCMNPIGMLVARARGVWTFDSAATAWTMHYPDFLIAGVAVVVSHVVSGLGEQVARAREMGSYQIGALIGRGGMGEVYRATHRMLARPAAIKLIRPEVLAARRGEQAQIAVERFHREAEAAAQLRSPHTVDLYDFGTTEDGTLYFAMELLDGLDLESLVRQTGPLPASRVVHVLRQVCESLEEAHASGLVHRDIKPANIHLGRFGLHADFVKVLDFGLVTSAGRVAGPRPMATAAGAIPGTPAYMAPEMALGERVDGRADIYALGCVAYYLLTGQLVFETKNPVQSLVRRLHEAPIAPSARTELPIPADLDALVLGCLSARPDDRPVSAASLNRQLAALAVAPWTGEQAHAWWAIHRPPSATAASSRGVPADERPTATAFPDAP